MSMEIKFRAYDKERKEFLSAGRILLVINFGRYPKSTDFYLDVYDERYKNMWKDRFETQQFTGICDKNRREIYDGDIVKSDDGKIGQVQWFEEHAAFMIWSVTDNKVYFLFDNDFSKIEVVGNIYENADLLKEEENE